MTPHEEAVFEKKAEKMLAGQREIPKGRNFLAWTLRYQNNQGYRGQFDNTFSGSPSSNEWLNKTFCAGCERRLAWCVCKDGEG